MNTSRIEARVCFLLASAILLLLPATTVHCAGPPSYAAAPAAGSTGSAGNGYPNVFDQVNLRPLLNNRHLVDSVIKCFLGTGPCPPQCKQFKDGLLSEIVHTVCAKCTGHQKNMARQILRHVYTNRRPEFEQIIKIYGAPDSREKVIKFMQDPKTV